MNGDFASPGTDSSRVAENGDFAHRPLSAILNYSPPPKPALLISACFFSFRSLPQPGPSSSSLFFQAARADVTTQQHRAATDARNAAAAAGERADTERACAEREAARAEREAARAELAEKARDALAAELSDANDALAASREALNAARGAVRETPDAAASTEATLRAETVAALAEARNARDAALASAMSFAEQARVAREALAFLVPAATAEQQKPGGLDVSEASAGPS